MTFQGYGCTVIHEAIHYAVEHGQAEVTIHNRCCRWIEQRAHTYAFRHQIRIITEASLLPHTVIVLRCQ